MSTFIEVQSTILKTELLLVLLLPAEHGRHYVKER